MARLWRTALMAQWHERFFRLPIESHIHEEQEAYDQAIADYNRVSSPDALIRFKLSLLRRIAEAAAA